MNSNPEQGVLIIAEAGVNHNGSLDLACRLVDAAAAAGADVVKFQTFVPEQVVSVHAAKAAYQTQSTGGGESQLEMVRKLRLDEAAHHALVKHCKERGITFLSTPFDFESLAFLVDDIGVAQLKIPSGEITNGPLLLAMARSGLPLIMSTGMSSLGDVEEALGVLAFGMLPALTEASLAAFRAAYREPAGQRLLRERVTLLHCTTEYPTPVADVNLRAMATLAAAFGLPVGYSDHTRGIAVSIAAAARGACVIEKHFTLDRTMTGPDHAASLEPDELAALVAGVRDAAAALGSPLKAPAPSEIPNIAIARKSLVAARAIAAGETFSFDNLAMKRPGSGVAPMHYWEILGTKATRDYQADEAIEL